MFNIENHIADYTSSFITCDLCNGRGTYAPYDRKELIKTLVRHDVCASDILWIYRNQYKKDGFIDCPCCGGHGGRERWN